MLDERDWEILGELMQDGRKSAIEISESLGIPRATVQERLRRLVSTGVIRRFAAIPDYAKIGKQVTAYVYVSFGGEQNVSQRNLAEQVAKIPGVYEVSVVSGDWDIMLKVRAGSVEQVGGFVVDRLRAIKGVQKTYTSVVFQTIKESF